MVQSVSISVGEFFDLLQGFSVKHRIFTFVPGCIAASIVGT